MENKILAMALLVPILLVSGIAFAEENSTISETNLSDEDQNQIKDFNYIPGAQLRMLQLERSIMRNILIGNVVINITEKNHPEANTTKMNIILDDMENLLEEVRNASLDTGPLEIAKQFVGFKKESVKLTQEFRNESIKYLNSTDRQEIHETIKNLTDDLKFIDGQIKISRCALNSKRFHDVITAMNASNVNITERIRNCNATLQDAKSEIRNKFGDLNMTGKINALKNVRAMAVESASVRSHIMTEIGKNLSDMMTKWEAKIVSNRLQIRSNISEKMGNFTERQARILNQSGMQIRAVIMQNISNRLEQRSEWLKNVSENVRTGVRK